MVQYHSKDTRNYKTPDEEQPTRTCENKSFIPKIMILTALACPRYADGICIFDGKIGCFPFVIYKVAKRSSKNRKARTIEMKPIDSIKQGVIREFLIDNVLPAICAKWPQQDANKLIYIHQDNAPSYVPANDKLFCEAAKQDGFDTRLICQLANSPDFNVLDLGFFFAIRSLQYKTGSNTTEELVAAVDKAFQDYSPSQANRMFFTLHGCFKEIMKICGGNGYNVPHICKGMLERQGLLSVKLSRETTFVDEAVAKLNA